MRLISLFRTLTLLLLITLMTEMFDQVSEPCLQLDETKFGALFLENNRCTCVVQKVRTNSVHIIRPHFIKSADEYPLRSLFCSSVDAILKTFLLFRIRAVRIKFRNFISAARSAACNKVQISRYGPEMKCNFDLQYCRVGRVAQ